MHSTLLCVNQPEEEEEEEEEEEQEVNPTEDKSCCECVTTFQSLCWSFQSIGQMVKVGISDVQICRMNDWTNEEMNEGMSD